MGEIGTGSRTRGLLYSPCRRLPSPISTTRRRIDRGENAIGELDRRNQRNWGGEPGGFKGELGLEEWAVTHVLKGQA
ncbi:hypothetical protein TB1_031123 [Malus domestica]